MTELTPELHINMQIHIDPRMPPEKLDLIFAAMEKHLYPPKSRKPTATERIIATIFPLHGTPRDAHKSIYARAREGERHEERNGFTHCR